MADILDTGGKYVFGLDFMGFADNTNMYNNASCVLFHIAAGMIIVMTEAHK